MYGETARFSVTAKRIAAKIALSICCMDRLAILESKYQPNNNRLVIDWC